MESITSLKPLAAVLVSLAASLLILLTGDRRPNLRETWTLLAAFLKFYFVFSLIDPVLGGKSVECTLLTIVPGAQLKLRVDAFGLYFGLLASGLWILTSVYSIGYMRGLREHAQTRYFFCFAVALSATLGIAFAANLLTLFIFYEMLSVSTWPLVAHKETPEALAAGRKYLVYTLTSGALIFFSSVIIFFQTGTMDFTAGGFLSGRAPAAMLPLLFALLLFGFGVKAAIMPIHEWLPSAMIAPTPVSALLHAVAVVKAGVFGCLRVILYIFGPELLDGLGVWTFFAFLTSFTILAAGLIALGQDNLKRRLAFSTINSLSMIILGALLMSRSGITGGILHLANHGFLKITLFFCAGAIYVKTRKELVSQLDGIGKQMPLTMGAFAVGAFGLAGIPPLNGFISKWYLCLGALEATEIFFLVVFLVSTLLDVAFFFPIVYNSFFKPDRNRPPHFDEAPLPLVIPLMTTAAMSVILGLYPDAFLRFFSIAATAAQNILGGG
jgi:multicomponent Na+:H+ antiporter subunit D